MLLLRNENVLIDFYTMAFLSGNIKMVQTSCKITKVTMLILPRPRLFEISLCLRKDRAIEQNPAMYRR